jgi:hypothetical protein
MRWLAVHNESGASDGSYALRQDAEEAARSLQAEHGGTWLVVRVAAIHGPADVSIPSDGTFHANYWWPGEIDPRPPLGEWLRWSSTGFAERGPPEVMHAPMAAVQAEAERTYRRGYQHGYVDALRALAAGVDPDTAHRHGHINLADWRYGDARREVHPPRAEP